VTGTGVVHEKRKRPRTCTGCGGEFPKRNLLRIVRRPDGEVVVDPSGRAPGRGAYICRKLACLELALKKKQLARSLKTLVPEKLISSLKVLLDERGDPDPRGEDDLG